MKSAFKSKNEGGDRIYTVNLTETFLARRDPRFYVLIGLLDPESESRSKFYVGFIPSAYIFKLIDDGSVRFNKEGRPVLSIFLSTQPNYPKFSLRLRYPPRKGKTYGEGRRANLEEYFSQPIRAALKAHLRPVAIVLAPETGRKRGPKPSKPPETGNTVRQS